MDALLVPGVIDFERLEPADGKARCAEVVGRQLGLEAPDHDGVALPVEFLGVGPHPARKPLVVEQLEEGGEAFRVAVVGRRAQEELVLEVRRQQPDGFGAERVGRVVTPAGRGAVVGLVDDSMSYRRG